MNTHNGVYFILRAALAQRLLYVERVDIGKTGFENAVLRHNGTLLFLRGPGQGRRVLSLW